MSDRLHHPINIMDYPRLPDTKIVIVSHNGVNWPSGGRVVKYMTGVENSMGSHNLWNTNCANALTFDTYGAAQDKVRELIDKAGRHGLRPNVDMECIMTVAELKRRVGYPTGPYRRMTG